MIAVMLFVAAMCPGSSSVAQVTMTRDTLSAVATNGGATFGSAWIDYDGDGDLDLFTVNFNAQDNALFRNDGGTFVKMTAADVGSIVADGGNSFGTSWGDYDNDGDLDAFVANANPSTTNEIDFLYRNDGGGMFTRILTGPIATAGGFTTGGSWVDYDNDGFLDLFAVNNNQVNFLFHNNGDGTFTRILTGDIVQSVARFHGCSWSDYDNDGDMDVFIACNIGSANRLYRNDGGGTFTKITTGAIVTDVGSAQGGSWGDYDNDGDMDLFVPNRSNQNNNLYRNNGDGTFTRMTAGEVGSLVGDGGDSFGSGWSDIDNDGDIDLFVANWSGQNNFLYINNGDGTFTRELSGAIVNDGGESQAVAWGDYDRDGFEDLFVANGYFANENDFLYRNDGTGNHWLTIACKGTLSNRTAIGTKVRVKAVIGGTPRWQIREIAEQTGAFGQSSLDPHFGLGDAAYADSVVVTWPNGGVEVYTDIPADQFMAFEESTLPAPNLLYAAAGNSSVRLTWRKRAIGNFDHYAIYADSAEHPTEEVGTVAAIGETTFTVTGLVNGTAYYFRVAVVNADSVSSAYSNEVSSTPLPIVSGGVPVRAKWNLLSLPLRAADSLAAILFPSASSPAYSFEGGAGYQSQEVLRQGRGYWMKFASADTLTVAGFLVESDSIEVVSGWNLVGSISVPVAAASIASDPPGMLTGQFYGYEQGYAAADTIRQGKAYWVKSSAAGFFFLGEGAEARGSASIRIHPDGERPPAPPREDVAAGTDAPARFGLVQNYPNPFNATTVIEYLLAERAAVRLEIVSVLGHNVATLVSGTQDAGRHRAAWDAGALPSGIYFCRLTARSGSGDGAASILATKKLALIR